jgi:hypothetical protein
MSAAVAVGGPEHGDRARAAVTAPLGLSLAFAFLCACCGDPHAVDAEVGPAVSLAGRSWVTSSGPTIPSPDGRWELFDARDDDSTTLCVRERASGAERRVLTVLREGSDGWGVAGIVAWSSDSREVLILGHGEVRGAGRVLPLVYLVEQDRVHAIEP